MNHLRLFTYVKNENETHGIYRGNTPRQAAHKCAAKNMPKNMLESEYFTVILKETTVGSEKKCYAYNCRRVKINPVNVSIQGGTTITYNFRIECKHIRLPPPYSDDVNYVHDTNDIYDSRPQTITISDLPNEITI